MVFSVSSVAVLAGVAGLVDASLKAVEGKDVLLPLAGACLLCLAGALAGAGTFKPTRLAEDPSVRCKDILDARPDFAVFNHRGPYLRSRQL